jgi:hypothetical protein
MYKRFICLMSLCIILGLAGSAPAAALVAHWTLDETTGTTAKDSSGHGFNGTLVNGPVWIAGTVGGALEFDGSNDYVNFGSPTSWPSGRAERSLCGWGKTHTVAAGYRWMAAYGSPATGQAMFIGMLGSTLVCGGYGADDVTLPSAWLLNEWIHVGLTYDGTTAKAYINGSEVSSGTKNWNLVLSRAYLGRQVNDGEYWDGEVDDVWLYSRALTAEQVRGLANGVAPVFAKAEKPSPADGAMGVSFPMLTWTPGEIAVFEDVYLGAAPDLTEANRVATHQSILYKMYYSMTPLTPGQTYYWRVDAIDATGTAIPGDVWSFTVTPTTAWAPRPANGGAYVDPNVVLEWSGGSGATAHDVYFGTDRAAVEAGTGGTQKKTAQLAATYTPGTLSRGTTYYWRVDEVVGASRVTGELWSFTVRPVIAKADPNLVGWWKLDDEISGTDVPDYSGEDRYGTLRGNPKWVEGYYKDALQLDGADDFVDFGTPTGWPAGTAARTLCGWGKTDTIGAGWRWMAAYGAEGIGLAMFIGKGSDVTGADLYGGGYGEVADIWVVNFWEVDTWHFICLTYDGMTAKLYADGALLVSEPKTWDLVPNRAHIGRQVNNAAEFWDGLVDDVRVYNKALTLEEITQVMRGDTTLAWNPQPKSGSNVDIRDATDLSWSPGDTAAQHDVYFGTDRAAVKAADAASPEYKGRQAGTSFSPADLVVFGGGAYFWRIDEVEADGTTVHKGTVWGFTVPDYLIVDEIENYTNESPNRIFQTWIDGWGFSADEFFPTGDPGNGTGAAVGHDIWATGTPYTTIVETSIVAPGGSKQSMPVDYNNIIQPYYSEIERTWSAPQNWTVGGVDTLSLQIRGYPAPMAPIAETSGKMTVTGEGVDIWGTSDQFTFVFKTITGDGSLVARVTSNGVGTDVWAKGGVMIRDSLDAGSAHTMMVMTGGGGNGASFQWRPEPDLDSYNADAATAVAPPYYVKIERTGDSFKGSISPDGTTWTQLGTSQFVTMSSPIYIGVCVTANAPGELRTFQFDNIKATGAAGTWQTLEVGLTRNPPASLYVVLQDSANKSMTVVNPDPAAVNAADWTEWQIPLSKFTGVNPAKIKKMYIGVGDRDNPKQDGHGALFIDNIRVIKPATGG